jgi:hypothetical protein
MIAGIHISTFWVLGSSDLPPLCSSWSYHNAGVLLVSDACSDVHSRTLKECYDRAIGESVLRAVDDTVPSNRDRKRPKDHI